MSCIVCGVEDFSATTCHTLCADCLPQQRQILAQDVFWDGIVRCPCGSGNVLDVAAPPARPPPRRLMADAVDCAAAPRCPWCDTPFSFDGCCAILCDCGNFFCGLCGARCSTSRAAHQHVARCPRNPRPPELFLSTHEVEAAARRRCAERAWREIWRAFCTHSVFAAFALTREMRAQGVPLFATRKVLFPLGAVAFLFTLGYPWTLVLFCV